MFFPYTLEPVMLGLGPEKARSGMRLIPLATSKCNIRFSQKTRCDEDIVLYEESSLEKFFSQSFSLSLKC